MAKQKQEQKQQPVIVEERILKRGGGAAATIAFLALLVAFVAFLYAFHANNRGNTAVRLTNAATKRVDQLQTRVNTALGQSSAPSNGTGVGPNNQQPVPPGSTGNTTPNGNGQ